MANSRVGHDSEKLMSFSGTHAWAGDVPQNITVCRLIHKVVYDEATLFFIFLGENS